MTVEVNIDYLLKNKITANEFLVIQMLLEKQDDRLKRFKKVVGEDEYKVLQVRLVEMDFLVHNSETDTLEITETCLRTFKGKGYFEEFYALFPVSVNRPDGKRESLRTDKKRCQTKYNRIAKRKDMHEHIIKCLEFEITERTRNDSLKYMKKMPNWLSSETWKEYGDKMKVAELIDTNVKETYGTNLL